ncbi:8265_t:CDS:1, partial [Funneliformis mosseae]
TKKEKVDNVTLNLKIESTSSTSYIFPSTNITYNLQPTPITTIVHLEFFS